MKTDEVKRLLQQLVGALNDCGLSNEADRVKRSMDLPFREVIDSLSTLERLITTSHAAWMAVVLCKGAITGRGEEIEFTKYVWKIQGITQ